MSESQKQFEQRKRDHIELALMPANQSSEFHAIDHIQLTHEACPDLDFNEIDISSQRFGRPTHTPFMISSMTAGHEEAEALNHRMMSACHETGWAMGVGSQRKEVDHPKISNEWASLRNTFPKVILFGNLGIAQLISSPLKQILILIESLQAEGFIIHLNALQECIQPEGTPHFKGSLDAIGQLVKASPVPIIIKETGCGFSQNTLKRLNDLGVSAVDVSGLGGTHWGRIETCRAKDDPIRQTAGKIFSGWGIDTVTSVKNAKKITPNFEIWGSGGVRHGLDAAKLIALGATTIGFAKMILEAALKGNDETVSIMRGIEFELKTAMFCTGSQTLNDLKKAMMP